MAADELNLFPRSNMPAKGQGPMSPPQKARPDDARGEVNGTQAPDGQIRLNFPSLSSEGRVLLTLPLADTTGFFKTEAIQARDLGFHISTQTNRAFRYGASGAQEEFAWYTGLAKGMQLLDERSQTRMQQLSRDFAKAGEPEEFFENEIDPFLKSLAPKTR